MLLSDEYARCRHDAKECLVSVLGPKIRIQYAAESCASDQLAKLELKKPRSFSCMISATSVVKRKIKLVNKVFLTRP